MTLREALDALHRAGRIRSPWLPGMRGDNGDGPYRVVGGNGRPPGARGGPRFLVASDAAINRPPDRQVYFETLGAVSTFDTSDPATVGCLAALAREAHTGRWPVIVVPFGPSWVVVEHLGISGVRSTHPGSALTEGEAWASALVAMAEALP